MKNLIINVVAIVAIILLSIQISNAAEKVIIVQAQGKVIRLNTADISYLKSKCNTSTMLPTLNALNRLTVIKNNDVADNILAIMAGRK